MQGASVVDCFAGHSSYSEKQGHDAGWQKQDCFSRERGLYEGGHLKGVAVELIWSGRDFMV